ncbi:MAG TPA: acyl-CoA thioesterase [Puia sp.]|jgi:YbgC/YbaW family acyl-CoA thioester hydrolase|nr:acyl-CoA thioesterase [Puia sp.]
MEKFPQSVYTVRFNDCDPFGHLNNSKYIDYFLNAREDHLKELYDIDLKVWAQQGQAFVVSAHEIRYLRPATYNESVIIQSALIGIGDSWLQVEMVMFDPERQLKAILWTVFTRIHPVTGKRLVHPAEFQPWIDQALAEGILVEKGLSARVESLRGAG